MAKLLISPNCLSNSLACSSITLSLSLGSISLSTFPEKNHGLPNIPRPTIAPSHPLCLTFCIPSAILVTSPLPRSIVSGAIEFLISTIFGIISQCASTSDISFRVLRCTVRAATPSFRILGNQVSISTLLYPILVLTDIGIFGAPLLAACITLIAFSGSLICPAPAPCFSTALSGHPILISIPSNPSSCTSLAASYILSG